MLSGYYKKMFYTYEKMLYKNEKTLSWYYPKMLYKYDQMFMDITRKAF